MVQRGVSDTRDLSLPVMSPDASHGQARRTYGACEASPDVAKYGPKSTVHSRPSDQLYGYALMAVSCLLFSSVALIVHVLEVPEFGHAIAPAFLVWFRSIIQFLLAVISTLVTPSIRATLPRLNKRTLRFVAQRGILGGISSMLLFSSLSLMPLGDAMTIFFLSPIFTVIISQVVLSEPATAFEYSAGVVAFIGVVLISQPPGLPFFGSGVEQATSQSNTAMIGAVCALSGALIGAMAVVTVRLLSNSVHFMLNVMSFGLGGTIVTLAVMGPLAPFRMLPGILATPGVRVLVLYQGFAAFVSQCCMNKALQHCTSVGVLIRKLDAPLAYLLGTLVLGEIPNTTSTVGAVLVLASVSAITVHQHLRTK